MRTLLLSSLPLVGCTASQRAPEGDASGSASAAPGASAAATAAATSTPTGTLVALNKAEATASLIDLASGRVVATVPVGDGPHEVAVSSDGAWAAVANYGGETDGNSITLIDLRQRAAGRTINLGEYRRPHGIAWLAGDQRLVVTSEASKTAVVVDVPRGAVAGAIPTGQEATHMVVVAPDGKRAYVANIGSGSVTMLDLDKMAAVRTVATGRGAEGIDVSPDGREVWVGNRSENTVTVLDARSLDALATLPSADFPIRVKFTRDGRTALVSHARSSELRLFDVAGRRAAATITLPLDPAKARSTVLGEQFRGSAVPIGILVHPGGRFAYVATAATDEIAEVDLERRAVTRYLRAGREPDGLGYSAIMK